MAQLKSGDKAPDFTLQDQNGKTIKLSDFKGRKLLVYFYPKAQTSGWTAQAQSVRDAQAELTNSALLVLGISPDSPDKQKKFEQKENLNFPLLSDTDHAVAKAYGVWGEKNMYGKKVEGIIRSSFLIDEKGKVLQAWYKISPADTVPKALEALAAWIF
jgi:thioredoxin-dependent peroxiredoxin